VNLLPAIPEPPATNVFPALRAVCVEVCAWANSTDDVDAINEAKHKLAAIDTYLELTSTSGRLEVAGAMRRLEVRIGALLGPPPKHGPGRGLKTSVMNVTASVAWRPTQTSWRR
jgi:hypothetical protein